MRSRYVGQSSVTPRKRVRRAIDSSIQSTRNIPAGTSFPVRRVSGSRNQKHDAQTVAKPLHDVRSRVHNRVVQRSPSTVVTRESEIKHRSSITDGSVAAFQRATPSPIRPQNRSLCNSIMFKRIFPIKNCLFCSRKRPIRLRWSRSPRWSSSRTVLRCQYVARSRRWTVFRRSQ